MLLLISDTNVLIDLEEGGLLRTLFEMPYGFKVPDVLYEEELKQEHSHLTKLGLLIGELTPKSMTYAAQIKQNYRQLSLNDCFAMSLAKQEQCPLLTGDKALRQASKKEAVLVYGTLWVVDMQILLGMIDLDTAIAAYNRMRLAGRRLPWDKVEASLKNYR